MMIKRRVLFLFLFFLLNNDFLHAINLDVPSIGFGGEQVGQAVSSIVQHVVTSPAGESLGYLFAKNFIPWIPHMLFIGGGLIITKYTVAFAYTFFSKISEYIDNFTNAPDRINDTNKKVVIIESKVDNIDTKVENVKTKLENLSIDVKELSNDIEEFRQDFITKNTSMQEKIFKMDANVLAVNEKIEDVVNRIDQLSEIQKITQKNTAEISNNIEDIKKQNSMQHIEALEQIQQLKIDFKDLKDCFNKIAELNIENKEFSENQSNLLIKMFKLLAEMQLQLEDVPKNVIAAKDALGNFIDNQDRNPQSHVQLTDENKKTLTQVFSGGMSGSGIFTILEPKIDKIQEEQIKANQQLEKNQEEYLKREEILLQKVQKEKLKRKNILQEIKSLNNSVQQLQSTFQDQKELHLCKEFIYSLFLNAQKQLQKNMTPERQVSPFSPQVITSPTTSSNMLSIGSQRNLVQEPNIPNKFLFFFTDKE